ERGASVGHVVGALEALAGRIERSRVAGVRPVGEREVGQGATPGGGPVGRPGLADRGRCPLPARLQPGGDRDANRAQGGANRYRIDELELLDDEAFGGQGGDELLEGDR